MCQTDGTVSGVTVKNGGNKLYSEEYTYNDDGLIAAVTVSDGRTYAYTYDENKNIVSVAKTVTLVTRLSALAETA